MEIDADGADEETAISFSRAGEESGFARHSGHTLHPRKMLDK